MCSFARSHGNRPSGQLFFDIPGNGSGIAGDAAAAAPGTAGYPLLLGQGGGGGGGNPELDQRVLRHLRWLLQKDALGQDMFLYGPPGLGWRNEKLTINICQVN